MEDLNFLISQARFCSSGWKKEGGISCFRPFFFQFSFRFSVFPRICSRVFRYARCLHLCLGEKGSWCFAGGGDDSDISDVFLASTAAKMNQFCFQVVLPLFYLDFYDWKTFWDLLEATRFSCVILDVESYRNVVKLSPVCFGKFSQSIRTWQLLWLMCHKKPTRASSCIAYKSQ